MKWFQVFLLVAVWLWTGPAVADSLPWKDICPNDPTNSYCRAVGKDAYNAQGVPALRSVLLGKIVGVAWRPQGSLIGISKAIPSAGIPQSIRLSPRDAYYFIIDDGHDFVFLRECREIEPGR